MGLARIINPLSLVNSLVFVGTVGIVGIAASTYYLVATSISLVGLAPTVSFPADQSRVRALERAVSDVPLPTISTYHPLLGLP